MKLAKNIKVIMIAAFCISSILYFAMSFSNFCFCDRKFHTQDEAMIEALIHLSKRNFIAPSINSAAQATSYLEANPDCCRKSKGVGEAIHYEVRDVLFSRAAYVVHIVAPHRESEVNDDLFYEAYLRVSCGKVSDRVGGSFRKANND